MKMIIRLIHELLLEIEDEIHDDMVQLYIVWSAPVDYTYRKIKYNKHV